MSAVLPETTVNGRARAAALRDHDLREEGVGTVRYHSQGRLLVIGTAGDAVPAARALASRLSCVLLVPPGQATVAAEEPGLVVLEGCPVALEGHLGDFRVHTESGGEVPAVADIDLILDLADPPLLSLELPPPGYYAPCDAGARQQALDELVGLVGEFEKPRYFVYDASICAHGRSGLAGCRRCLDACPAQAIHSLGEQIEVDPYLCQGGGGCATACPSGAIRYAFPGVATLLSGVRDALVRYRDAGGVDPQVLFHDAADGAVPEQLAHRAPESVLPFQVEELGSVGLDTWLACLAYGARRVLLFTTRTMPRAVLREVSLQVSYARAILDGMGYRPDCLSLLVEGDRDAERLAGLSGALPSHAIAPATFMPFDDKRTTLGLAIDHLHAEAPRPRPIAPLPDDAPFGAVEIDTGRCTLCMACVSVCPGRALYAGNDHPALQFLEANCVQCGLCCSACPEDAVRLLPRMNYDGTARRALHTLYEEQPFHCVRCGRPFATAAVIERMTQRLADHWMFRDSAARRRIGMCQDCRAVDVFEAEHGIDVYAGPAHDA